MHGDENKSRSDMSKSLLRVLLLTLHRINALDETKKNKISIIPKIQNV